MTVIEVEEAVGMAGEWSRDTLQRMGRDKELRIAAYRADGTLRSSVLVWSVVHDDAIVVRSWYRKEKGWNNVAAHSGRARIHVADGPVDVVVHDEGAEEPALRRGVDDAYRRKYGEAAGGMISDAAAGTTLRLVPDVS